MGQICWYELLNISTRKAETERSLSLRPLCLKQNNKKRLAFPTFKNDLLPSQFPLISFYMDLQTKLSPTHCKTRTPSRCSRETASGLADKKLRRYPWSLLPSDGLGLWILTTRVLPTLTPRVPPAGKPTVRRQTADSTHLSSKSPFGGPFPRVIEG